MAKKKRRETFGFKFERKRIKRDKKLPVLCKDYEPGNTDNCKKGGFCKNATYGRKDQSYGTCYGGTKSSEIEHRKNI